MLVYEATKEEFMTSVELGSICEEIYEVYQLKNRKVKQIPDKILGEFNGIHVQGLE